MLEIAFETRQIREICLDNELAETKLGSELAASLMKRIADLRASASVLELVAGNPNPIGTDKYSVSLSEGFKLIFCANHVPPRILPSGSTDWENTHRIKILGWEILE